ncbi:MAG TPA: inositol monophosphatase family protein [Nitrospinota bacterium]|nr:inositol monophosphatase family protein [Nitrospinota bacterium]
MKETKRENLLDTAIEAAKAGGAILKKNYGQPIKVEHKGAIDLVTEVDKLSEKVIIDIIKKKYPEHTILSEEKGLKKKGSPYKWIVDPLDGTTNYAHGYPVFCVSVALEIDREVVLGVIYDPILEEIFIAQKGKGAYLNGKKISVSKIQSLSDSLLVTGFPYDIRKNTDDNINHFRNFCKRAQAVRRPGSAALDLCYVAIGRFEGFWEMKLFPWDVAAGALLVREAGGKVTDFKGNSFDIYGKEVLASNGFVHKAMVEVLASK